MVYSSTALVAILIQCIINHDILFGHNREGEIPAQRAYFRFLLATMAYYITDAMWGILDSLHLTRLLYADTVIYYVAMASAVLLWTRYVIEYLEKKDIFTAVILYTGRIFFVSEILFLIINFFAPVFFSFDADGAYRAGKVRYIALVVQIVFFMVTSVYTFYVMAKTEGSVRRRNRTVALFGLSMAFFITIQFFYPLLPLYSMGYMIGICLLHTFVIEDVKNEYRSELELALKREKEQKKELGSTRRLANTDPLTGVKNKRAFMEREEFISELMADRAIDSFGVVVMDLNGLKRINDTKGHEAGDQYIVSACKIICDLFKHSPVYRIGGDEFAVILNGADFRNRMAIMESFDSRMERNAVSGKVVISLGFAEYDSSKDEAFSDVFKRADAEMYEHKKRMKEAALRQ